MSESDKRRKIIVLATGAAVALSATAIVLQQRATTTERTSIQSALRDGAQHATDTGKASEWLRMACSAGSSCND
jgi:hypothetical protein